MRVPATLLLLICATPVGSAFGLVGGGGVWRASERRCARHVRSSGPDERRCTGIGLPSCRRVFAFASGRISRPSVVVITTNSRNGHVLRAASEEDGISEERAKLLLLVTKEEIDDLVRNNPSLLDRRDIVGNHGPKLSLLQERLGIDQKEAGRLCLKNKRLLNISLATLENRMDWLQQRLNLNKSQMRTIVQRNPRVLTLSIENSLEPTIDGIQSSLELSDEEMVKMIVNKPLVLDNNMSAENISQRLSLLQEILDLPEGDIKSLKKYTKRTPLLLFWSKELMKDVQQWIQQRFGLGDAKIARMSKNQPLMLFSNTATLDHKADLIQADLSLSDEELSDIVSKFPVILRLSPEENVRPMLQYLRTRFELDEAALKNWILKAPSLISYSENTIEERLQFYSNLVGEREAKRLVIKSYNLLMKSLNKRLKPRLEEVEKSGVKVRWNETLLRRMAVRTNDQWERYKLGEAPRGRAAS